MLAAIWAAMRAAGWWSQRTQRRLEREHLGGRLRVGEDPGQHGPVEQDRLEPGGVVAAHPAHRPVTHGHAPHAGAQQCEREGIVRDIGTVRADGLSGRGISVIHVVLLRAQRGRPLP